MATKKGAKPPAGRAAKGKTSTAMGMNKKASGRGKPASRARGAAGGGSNS
jgi:hypothetical protein